MPDPSADPQARQTGPVGFLSAEERLFEFLNRAELQLVVVDSRREEKDGVIA